MATRVTLNTIDGELVVDKVALDGDRSDRTAEARWLAQARSPHVVRLISFENSIIRTRHAGQTTLRTSTLGPPEVAGLLLGLTRVLTDLHGRGLVHGKLTLDHVIVATRPGTSSAIVLCSPAGTATDPSVDMQAIGGIVDRLVERWDERGIAVPKREHWERVRSRLQEPDDQVTAQRLARWLAPLVVSAPPARDDGPDEQREQASESGRPTPRFDMLPDARGVAIVLGFVGCAIGATFWNPLTRASADEAPAETFEIAVGGQTYEVAGAISATAGAPANCMPEAAVLDAESTVWRFVPPNSVFASIDEVSPTLDGTVGSAEATVPGATELAYEACELWAIGPAGRTKLERP